MARGDDDERGRRGRRGRGSGGRDTSRESRESQDSRGDIAWKHGQPIDGDKRHTECNYCHKKLMGGGATRLKQHLVGNYSDVAKCREVPNHIAKAIAEDMKGGNKRKAAKEKSRIEFEEAIHAPVHRRNDDSDDDDDDDPMYVPDDIDNEQEARNFRHMQELSRQSLHEDMERRRHGGAGPSRAGGSGSRIPMPFRRSQSTRAAPTPAPPSPLVVPPRVNPVLQQDPRAFRKKGNKQRKIKGMWGDMKSYVGGAISRWMLFHSIPANATTGPYYQSMIDAVAEAGPGIKGPTAYEVMNVYLPKEKAELEAYITELKVMWESYGVTIMCDGWTGPTKKSIINFMVYCDGRTIFLKSVDASKERKDSKYIYKLLKDVVEEVGIQNVVQIVTDNGSNYKKAGIKMMDNPRFQLFWTPCAAHCIDLMLKDMGKLKIVKTVVERARQVSTFVYNHTFSLNLLREKCEGDLVRPGLTRFATNYIALQSFESKKAGLRSMFASKEWFEWKEASTAGGREAQRTIASERFWTQLGKVVKILAPIVSVLKMVDSAFKPTLPSLWAAIAMMKEHVYAANPRGSQKFVEIIEERWERQLSHPLHKDAYYLNPRYQYSKRLALDPELLEAVKQVVAKLQSNPNLQAKANTETKEFRDALGSFGAPAAYAGRTSTDPAEWWVLYGSSAPELRKIAIKVLSQTCSASGCERNWSTFSLIHSKRRNRLGSKRLNDLVYVHYNMRLRMQHIRMGQENDRGQIELADVFQIDSDDEDPLVDWVRDRGQPLMDQPGGRPDPFVVREMAANVDDYMATDGIIHSQTPRPFEPAPGRDDDDDEEEDWSISSGGRTHTHTQTHDDDGGDEEEGEGEGEGEGELHGGGGEGGGDGDDVDGEGDEEDTDDDHDSDDGGGDGDRFEGIREQYPQPDTQLEPMHFTGESQFQYATQDSNHGARPSGGRSSGYSRGPRRRFGAEEQRDCMDIDTLSTSIGGMSFDGASSHPHSESRGSGQWRPPSFSGGSTWSEYHGPDGQFTGMGHTSGSSIPTDYGSQTQSHGSGFMDSLFSYPTNPYMLPEPSVDSNSAAGSSSHYGGDTYPRIGYLRYVDDTVFLATVNDYVRFFSQTMTWHAFVEQSEENTRQLHRTSYGIQPGRHSSFH